MLRRRQAIFTATRQGLVLPYAGARDMSQEKRGTSEGHQDGCRICRLGPTLSAVVIRRTLGILLAMGAYGRDATVWREGQGWDWRARFSSRLCGRTYVGVTGGAGFLGTGYVLCVRCQRCGQVGHVAVDLETAKTFYEPGYRTQEWLDVKIEPRR
jgi:hypothetical protein